MADKEVNLKIEVDASQSIKTMGQLEDEFERLNEEIRKVPVNSKEFKELQGQIAQTGREVKNLELSFEALDNEQIASELGSVSGAIGDVSAAFILLGDDSETLQEVAKNIEFAMGLSMGLKGAIEGVSSARKLLTNSTVIQNGVEKISNLVKVGAFATNAQLAASETARGAATVGATTATTAATAGMKLFRLALIATGIGAFVVLLGLLIANFDKVKNAMQSVTDFIYETFKPQIDVVIGALEWLGLKETEEEKMRAARQSAAIEKRKEETRQKIALIDEQIAANKKLTDDTIANLDFDIAKRQAAGEDTAKLERDKLNILIKSTKEEIRLTDLRNEARIKELEIIALMNGHVGDMARERLEEIEAEQLGLMTNLEKLNQQLEIFDIKQDKLKSDRVKKASEDRKKLNEKEAEEERKRLEKEQAELDKIIITNAEARSAKKIELIEEEKSAYLDYMALIQKTAQEQAEREEQARIEKQEKLQQDLDNTANLISSLTQLNNTALEAELEGAGNNEAKKQEIRKKAFARDKALKIAEATMSGIQAVQSALASPFPFNIALAVVNGATALANITKIARTKFEGSGGGGSTPSSLGNTARGAGGANVDQVTNTTTTIGEPTKVYVTEQDISNTQNKVSVNEAQATI